MLTLLLALASHPAPVDDSDGLRSAVVALGDVDGDGVGDFALAQRPRRFSMFGHLSPFLGWPAVPHQPVIWVLSGADGALLRTFRGAHGFGTELVGVGDLDGDDLEEIAVQIPVVRLVRVLQGADLSVLWSIDILSLQC